MNASSRNSRRTFLKMAAMSGAALGTGLAVPRSVHAAGSDLLTVGLIGCGGRGAGAAGNALAGRKETKLIAMGDLFRDQAVRMAGTLKAQFNDRVDVPEERIFDGFDAYTKVIACNPDIILLGAPPGFRPLHYMAAVQARKHVFMEKPCCVDAPGYRLVMKANQMADDNGLKVTVGLQRRHSKSYNDAIPKLQEGAIGKILFLRCYWNGEHAHGGYGGEPPKQRELEWQIKNWNHFCWLSGDHIVEQHVHNIDVCNWILKDAHPTEANGMGGREVRKKSNMYDHHFVEFTYADGTKMYSQCRQIGGCWNPVTEFAHGTTGSMELGGNGNDGYEKEHVNLVAAIKSGAKLNDGWHGANSTMTAVLGRMATHSGQVVLWDKAVQSEESLAPEYSSLDAKPPVTVGPDGLYPVDVPGVYKPYKNV
ncbi:MAG: twin-arginine translocation signal domain-containing protein [Planctomycetes bacterium]|nr:twin-arginine translocation signal domain-containing protein [Planctomycetota bacterium]